MMDSVFTYSEICITDDVFLIFLKTENMKWEPFNGAFFVLLQLLVKKLSKYFDFLQIQKCIVSHIYCR